MDGKDRLMFDILDKAGVKLKKSAVIVMLEDGITTQEADFDDYRMAFNLDRALNTVADDDTKIRLLTEGLDAEKGQRLLSSYRALVSSRKAT